MQTLEIISVNIWNALVSLCNLLLLYLILKKFLYKPVKKVLSQRQAAIDEQYASAQNAERDANDTKKAWEQKMLAAEDEADNILKTATVNAENRGNKIVAEAKEKADVIIRQAQNEAQLEVKKAQAGIKEEIVNVSVALTEKMLNREIDAEDHRELIDSFIREIGDDDDADE